MFNNKKTDQFIKKISRCLVLTVFFFYFILLGLCSAGNIEKCFKLAEWEVGQFAEYRIIGFDDIGNENRYILSVEAKEQIDGIDYFWLRYEIFNSGGKEAAFRALCKPVTEEEFAAKPVPYISDGLLLLFKKSRRFFVSFREDSELEVDPVVFFNDHELAANSFYEQLPDEKERIDFSKLKISKNPELVDSPAGFIANCFRFYVNTTKIDSFSDVGMDVLRSADIPLLGIVRVEFSKIKYREKKRHRKKINGLNKTWWQEILAHIFIEPISRIDGKDSYYLIELISFGMKH